MKVLFVIPDLASESGGPVSALKGMAAELARHGVDVRILSTDFGISETPKIEGCEVEVFPCRFKLWRWSPSLGRALARYVKKADLVHIDTLWLYPTLAASRAAYRSKVPYIVRPCGMLDAWSLGQSSLRKRLYSFLIERTSLNRASALWFTTDEERQRSQKFGYRCEEKVLPLGIDSRSFENGTGRESLLQAYDQAKGRKAALFLGRLHPKKRPDLLIRAFTNLDSDICLVFAGDGPTDYVAQLKLEVDELGLSDRVIFTGHLSSEDVASVFFESHVFILPSRSENFGRAAIEAMACGLPVIVSNEVNLSRLIREAGAGIVLDMSEERLSDAMNELLSDEEKRSQMGRRGRELVHRNYTWSVIASDVIEFYSAVHEKRFATKYFEG